ncbi:histidine kinase [Streptomyces europaeiscabiei]
MACLSLLSAWWALPTAIVAFMAGRRPGPIRRTALGLVAVLAVDVTAAFVIPSWLSSGSQLAAVVVGAVMLPWFAGRFWSQYQELVRAGWERAEHLEREQRLVAEQARLRERARIAQDMHDSLGHDLSLIALSAGALKLAPGLSEQNRQAAHDIRAKAASAVERLGDVIGVLSEAPTLPSDTSITRLVEEAQAAGLTVDLRVEGEAEGLPKVVERAAYRVVQEGLTNAVKHAPHADATVTVSHGATETTVVVENGPPPSSAHARPGQGGRRGLIGLDERVRLVGGRFEYGARGRGFVISARMPHVPQPPQSATQDLHSPTDLTHEHQRARRRVGRTLVAAAMVPLITGGVISVILTGWNMMTASWSVLDPGDYARLRVGQDRFDIERVLPDRQTTDRPKAPEPKGEGVTCEYYAMTADRFDDRSGDAYRICFKDGKIASLDALTP